MWRPLPCHHVRLRLIYPEKNPKSQPQNIKQIPRKAQLRPGFPSQALESTTHGPPPAECTSTESYVGHCRLTAYGSRGQVKSSPRRGRPSRDLSTDHVRDRSYGTATGKPELDVRGWQYFSDTTVFEVSLLIRMDDGNVSRGRSTGHD